MPLAEAVKRAGSLEALRPHLRAGSILARHGGLYTLDGAPKPRADDRIPARWWADARDIDPTTGRALFTEDPFFLIGPNPTADTLAIGVELERATIERLFPVAPKPPGRKRGAKLSPVWQQIFSHFDPIVAREGKFPSVGSAASSVEEWLEKNNKTLSRRAIERGIPKYRPDWIAA
jgi:hypothetical protein